jgi:hypothetical protein
MNSSVQRENQKNYHMPVVLYSYPEPFDTIQSKISIEKNERILDESIHDEYEHLIVNKPMSTKSPQFGRLIAIFEKTLKIADLNDFVDRTIEV